MANPALEARAKVNAAHPEAVVVERGRNSIKHRLADASDGRQRFALDVAIGPLHYGPNEDQEIDTALVPSTAPWDWEMTKAGFEVRALSDLSAGQVIEYRSGSEWVRFQPMALQYSNDLNQIQQISMPQAVDATVDDDMLTWTDGYGPGRTLTWQAQTARLAKLLTINTLADLPTVDQFILDGGNSVLELNLIFAFSSGVEPYVNGQPWGKGGQTQDKDTQGLVEFRDDQGNILWWFNLPRSWDADGNEQLGTLRFKKQGNSLYVSHRVPLSFVQGAVYPLSIDVTIDEQVGASTDDATEMDTGSMVLSQTWAAFGNFVGYRESGFRFEGISGLSGGTIDVASLTFYAQASDTGSFVGDFYAHDAEAPGTFTTTDGNVSDTAQRPRTTATCEADSIDFGNWTVNVEYPFDDSGSDTDTIKDIIQELANSYDPSVIVILFIFTSGNGERLAKTYDNDTSLAAKLHIEYTAGGGITVTPTTLALILSEFAPTVTATGDIVVTPSTLAQTLAAFAPTVSTPRLVTPGVIALTLAEFVPTVTATANQLVTPPTLALTLATFAPTATATENQLVTPSVLALILSEFAPTVTATGDQLVTPTTLALLLTEFVPTVTVSGIYTSYGAPFLYTAANWNAAVEFFLEVYLKAIAGTVRARLYNDTDATVVTDSGLSTAATSYTRLRSSALSLTDGKIYLVQFGTESVANGEFKAGKLIAV